MKKILELKGIKELTKKDQKQITGSTGRRFVYCGPPGQCCMTFLGGPTICDFGYCQPNGTCIWA